jgi:hypothetical protein
MHKNAGDISAYKPLHRKIYIESRPNLVTARIMDCVHDFSIVMAHDGNVITALEPSANRTPWSTCSGALEQFQALLGAPLEGESGKSIDKGMQCTHLFDLARLAMANAKIIGTLIFDVHVGNGTKSGEIEAYVLRNGAEILRWTIANQKVISPGPFEGHVLQGATIWPPEVNDAEIRTAALLIRRALLVFLGTNSSRDARFAADLPFMAGACFTFQPANMAESERPANFRILEPGDFGPNA